MRISIGLKVRMVFIGLLVWVAASSHAAIAGAAAGGIGVGDDSQTGSVGTGGDSGGTTNTKDGSSDDSQAGGKSEGGTSGRQGGGISTRKPGQTKKRAGAPPQLSELSLAGAKVTYRIDDNSRRVTVKIAVISNQDGRVVLKKNLGEMLAGRKHNFTLSRFKLGPGHYRLVLGARDPDGYKLKAKKVARTAGFNISDHYFPVDGPWSWSGSGGEFGADRPGHIHQGYDVIAAEGAHLVTPVAGTISYTEYQAKGAGYYVVLDGDDGYDYAFMHLQEGTTRVKKADRVGAGHWIGNVGSTGDSSGPHLHFEIWQGAWQLGGKPVDPRPFLKAWAGGQSSSSLDTQLAAPAEPLD